MECELTLDQWLTLFEVQIRHKRTHIGLWNWGLLPEFERDF